ncbi:unnamed protein product [Trichobilharzia regenti]|nr:unnamed protein product [Trichobilharzia regenti]
MGITRYRFCALCNAQSPSNVCPDSCSQLLASCLHGDGPNEAQLAYIWPQLIGNFSYELIFFFVML